MISKNIKSIIIAWSVFLIILIAVYSFFMYKIRDTVLDFAISNAEGRLLTITDNAVNKYLSDSSVTYSNISNISRDSSNNITGIEMDSKLLSILKTDISRKISADISSESFVRVGIPIGTLFSFDVFNGIGPKLYFRTQFYEGYKIEFLNFFEDTGINQVRHSIVMKVTLTTTAVTIGKRKSATTETSFIIAETVIVGDVPNSFTDFSGGTIQSIKSK